MKVYGAASLFFLFFKNEVMYHRCVFGLSRYLVGAPMPQDRFYNSPRNIYRAVSFKTRIWTGWTDFVAW